MKSDTGIVYRAIAESLAKTNGSEIRISTTNAENTQEMHYLTTKILRWSGGSRSPGHRRPTKKKGWLANVISDAKNQIRDGLTT